MTPAERRASIALASVSGLRMLGMFIILPVFALWAEMLPGGEDHALIGIALGSYGVTQALLQIPFGWLSDRIGRKRVLYIGLALLAIGSLVAALAPDLYWVILGRTLQGAGAISSVVIALTADLTRDDQRTKAMAIIGISIGAAFVLSIMAGPILGRVVGVPGIFALTAVLAIAAMAVVRWVVPDPEVQSQPLRVSRAMVLTILRNGTLARLNYGIFVLHAVLIALFVVVPFSLRSAGLPGDRQWAVYLPVMLVAAALMLPPLLWSERRNRRREVFVGAIVLLVVAQVGLGLSAGSVFALAVSLTLFFAAFNLLEASLPALVSRAAPAQARGTAVGLYSSVQFLGAALGGIAGGVLSQRFGAPAVYALCAGLTLSWLLVAVGILPGARVGLRTYPVPQMDAGRADRLTRKLAGVPGVRAADVRAEEGVAHLRVDSRRFDEGSVLRLIAAEG